MKRQTSRRRLAVGGALVVAVTLIAAGVIVANRGGGSSETAARQVSVSDNACALGWSAPTSGRTVFSVVNESAHTTFSVALVGANENSIYGQIQILAPETAVPMDVVLPPGGYSFRCQSVQGYVSVSQIEQVSGQPVTGAHPYDPVTNRQLDEAMLTYRSSLLPLMQQLETSTDRLVAAIRAGKLAEARKLWLPAHMTYSQLGVGYDTFGKFNDEINGRPNGLIGGVHNPNFQGLLRIEYGLWHGQSAAELTPPALALDHAVHGLVRQFPTMTIPSGDLPLRAHEILENTLQFELTGETDQGSNTNLATAWANVHGTQLAMAALGPLLRKDNSSLLTTVNGQLRSISASLQGYRRPGDNWVALQSLPTLSRQHLNGAVSGLLEHLSLIPDILQPSGTAGAGDD